MIQVYLNHEKKGIEIKFEEKPNKEILEHLKANGFRWSKYQELWYAKDSEARRKFISSITEEAMKDKESSNIKYPEININDIETYIVSKELSKRENDGHWLFRTEERDHQKELQGYLMSCNQAIIELLQGIEHKEIEYRLKKWLQSYKKRYYKWYINQLSAKANNPSWVVTGRSGRNKRKDEKYNNRMDTLMREYIKLEEEYKTKIMSFKGQIHRLV
ncbi:hypothetical protein [Clostridium sp.]|uniref:hypothetical protein n=1 Tax=Clostridium sp. TaxID=1506 RepID=UPI003F3A4F5C